MDGITIAVVLCCACSTALLNCALRNERDPVVTALMVSIGGAVVAIPALFFTGLPGLESAPYLIVSTLIGSLYWLVLGRAYASGEISIVFPLAYGSAPIWILLLSGMVFSETLSNNQMVVISVICAGLMLVVSAGARGASQLSWQVLKNSLATTVIICTYTLCDAMAVRNTGNGFAYTVFLYASSGVLVFAISLLRCHKKLANAFAANRYIGLLWGALSLVNYSGELWAMARAPVALVAALRESSILFAIIFAVFWLKEPMNLGRITGGGVVAVGLILLRLA